MYGMMPDCTLELPESYYGLEDYQKGVARWCPGCGDHAVLSAVQRLCREKQLPPEKTVFVSGIGCSSRFPHYMGTYGFHGLHGRAFPVASGVKFRRPDLNVFVVTGDGDCCSIGAGHWVHGVRYNMDITVLLFDNEIYGMTKKQTSPTSPMGTITNTHPTGSVLPPVDILQTTLGLANVSFVAQTTDWVPGHLYSTIKKAFEHPGFSFVKIMMRCPKFMKDLADEHTSSRDRYCLLDHHEGIEIDESTDQVFEHKINHDPANIHQARELLENNAHWYLGLFYQNKKAVRYDLYGSQNLGFSAEQKMEALEKEMDKFAI